jgi:hypothetical protein
LRAKKPGVVEARPHATNAKAEVAPDLIPQPQPQAQAAGADEGAEPEPCGAPPVTKHRLYQDDTVPSFFRRLAFTPDGSLLLTPTGLYAAAAAGSGEVLRDTTHAFSRANLTKYAGHGEGRACAHHRYERTCAMLVLFAGRRSTCRG